MAAGATGGGAGAPYRIMLVDDSAVIRGLYTKVIAAEPDIEIVASVGDGEMALRALERNDVEVAVLDIEMPRMDGLTALCAFVQLHCDTMHSSAEADTYFMLLAAAVADRL
ncbi:MAG: response regulator, partial [Oceanibaculum sp.]